MAGLNGPRASQNQPIIAYNLADFKMILSGTFKLLSDWSVCKRGGEREGKTYSKIHQARFELVSAAVRP